MEKKFNIKESQKKITISDVAKELGVSKTTISRAISGKGRIGTETRERILKYITENNYHPNVIARSLAQSKTYNIGVVMPAAYTLNDFPFFHICMMGICDMAATRDYDVLVTIVPEGCDTQLSRIVSNNKVDGVILTRTLVNDKAVEFLKQKNLPFVAIGNTYYDNVIQVDNNHYEACKELTSTLLMRRFHNIALIGGNENHVVTKTRYKGFVDAFADQNMPHDKNMVFLNADTSVVIDKIVSDIIHKGADCIVCMDDYICGNVLDSLKARKIKIPEDIKVASFYDSCVLEKRTPAITTLAFDVKELGIVTCRTLLDAVEGKPVKQKTLLGYEIVLKESTK